MGEMVTTPQFLVMVDGRIEEARLLEVIRGSLPECEPYRRGSVHVRGNLLEINANEDANPELAVTDDDEGYLYYRWRVEVTPSDQALGEDHQVELAREIIQAAEGAGLRAVVCAPFEDRFA